MPAAMKAGRTLWAEMIMKDLQTGLKVAACRGGHRGKRRPSRRIAKQSGATIVAFKACGGGSHIGPATGATRAGPGTLILTEQRSRGRSSPSEHRDNREAVSFTSSSVGRGPKAVET